MEKNLIKIEELVASFTKSAGFWDFLKRQPAAPLAAAETALRESAVSGGAAERVAAEQAQRALFESQQQKLINEINANRTKLNAGNLADAELKTLRETIDKQIQEQTGLKGKLEALEAAEKAASIEPHAVTDPAAASGAAKPQSPSTIIDETVKKFYKENPGATIRDFPQELMNALVEKTGLTPEQIGSKLTNSLSSVKMTEGRTASALWWAQTWAELRPGVILSGMTPPQKMAWVVGSGIALYLWHLFGSSPSASSTPGKNTIGQITSQRSAGLGQSTRKNLSLLKDIQNTPAPTPLGSSRFNTGAVGTPAPTPGLVQDSSQSLLKGLMKRQSRFDALTKFAENVSLNAGVDQVLAALTQLENIKSFDMEDPTQVFSAVEKIRALEASCNALLPQILQVHTDDPVEQEKLRTGSKTLTELLGTIANLRQTTEQAKSKVA
jgi:hypothetical protein